MKVIISGSTDQYAKSYTIDESFVKIGPRSISIPIGEYSYGPVRYNVRFPLTQADSKTELVTYKHSGTTYKVTIPNWLLDKKYKSNEISYGDVIVTTY